MQDGEIECLEDIFGRRKEVEIHQLGDVVALVGKCNGPLASRDAP